MILNEQGKVCPCKLYICKRHGHCAACREFHRNSAQKPLTVCELKSEKERKQNGNQGSD